MSTILEIASFGAFPTGLPSFTRYDTQNRVGNLDDAMKRKHMNSSPPDHSAKSKPEHVQDNDATLFRVNAPHNEFGDGFSASLMDGPSVDLFKVAGLEETDQLHDAVWSKFNWRSLLGKCGSANIIEAG